MEVDLVAHCGDSTRGEYLNSLDMVDVKTRWVELAPLINRSQATVTAAITDCQLRLPFRLLGLDSDNGSEFINNDLKRHCEKEGITFTRCRPYKKNDQAYVEQKNWTAVRQVVGYDRFEGQVACQALNAVYQPLCLYLNFFQPVMVLIEKSQFALWLLILPPIMTVIEAKSPHTWDNFLLYIACWLVIYLVVFA